MIQSLHPVKSAKIMSADFLTNPNLISHEINMQHNSIHMAMEQIRQIPSSDRLSTELDCHAEHWKWQLKPLGRGKRLENSISLSALQGLMTKKTMMRWQRKRNTHDKMIEFRQQTGEKVSTKGET